MLPYDFLRPLFFKMEPEKAHDLTLKALQTPFAPHYKTIDDPALRVTLWNRHFPNPVGLAAGFDKNAAVIAPMLQLGFGFVEAGTVTPKPQAGNPKPRIYRDVRNEAVINRMGFPNAGLTKFKDNLGNFSEIKPRPNGVIGLNIGMNKDQTDPAKDYRLLVQHLAPMADYLAINISSPNTPGLRDLQKRGPLMNLIGQVMEERRKACKIDPPPLLVKFAPDLTEEQQGELVGAVIDSGIDGIILTNTTLGRPDYLDSKFALEKGGLSGAPLRDKSTAIIRNFYELTKGKVPIIGLGGISGASDAYEKIKAGASLVQVYTGLIYKGPTIARDINQDLLTLLKQDEYTHIHEAVGADTKLGKKNKHAA